MWRLNFLHCKNLKALFRFIIIKLKLTKVYFTWSSYLQLIDMILPKIRGHRSQSDMAKLIDFRRDIGGKMANFLGGSPDREATGYFPEIFSKHGILAMPFWPCLESIIHLALVFPHFFHAGGFMI